MEQENKKKLEFSVSSGELSQLFQKIQKIVPSKSAQPIYSNMLFEIKDGVLSLTGSDGIVRVTGRMNLLSSTGNMSIGIRPKDMGEYIRNLSEQVLVFECDMETPMLNISFSTGNFSIPYASMELYPKGLEYSNTLGAKQDEIQHSLILDIQDFCEGLDFVCPAATPKGNTKDSAIIVDFEEEGLLLVAGSNITALLHKANCCKNVPLPEGDKIKRILIPLKIASFIKDFSYEEDQMLLSYSRNKIFLTSSSLEISAILMDPSQVTSHTYKVYFKEQSSFTVEVDTILLLDTLKRMNSLLNSEEARVQLMMEDGVFSLEAMSPEEGGYKKAKEILPLEFSKELKMLQVLKLSSVLSAVSSLGSSKLTIHYRDLAKNLMMTNYVEEGEIEKSSVIALVKP